ncbi:MAG: helicase-associated domain-containing protein, partial [bacterium]|nr:helicase-associated domain-containing protein [bacterium]
MKLRAILSLQSVDKLRHIASVTGLQQDPKGNKTVLVDLLCTSLTRQEEIQKRLGTLSAGHRALVCNLAAEGGELLVEEAVHELGGGRSRKFQTFLNAASDAGLAFEDPESLGKTTPLVGIPEPVLKSIELPENHSGRLRQAMKSPSIGILRAFAKTLDVLPEDTRRPFVVRAIRTCLLDPECLKEYLNSLTENKRAILDLVLRNSAATSNQIQQQLGESVLREVDEMVWKTPIFFLETDRVGPDTPIRLAADLRMAIQELADTRGGQLQSHPEENLDEAIAPPSTIRDNRPHLLQDLATLLGFILQKRPRMLKRGGVARGELREARRFYRGDDDPGYSEFLLLFAESSGLLQTEGRTWTIEKSAAARLDDGSEIRKTLLAFWQETERWNEWTADRASASGRKARMDELKALRRDVLQALLRCPRDQWIAYSRFYDLLTRTSEAFRYLAEQPATGRTLAAGGASADELLRRMLRGALMWIGLVRTGNPETFAQPLQQNGKAAFQVSSAGAALLEGHPDPDEVRPHPDVQFILQPNLDVLAPPDLLKTCYLELFGLADPQEMDVMARFLISRDSLQRAMNRSLSGDAIRKFLKTHSATGLPDIVDALIRECESKHGEIEITPVPGYVTVEHESLLDELYAQERVAQCLGERISPLAAGVHHSTRPEVLFQTLRKQGYMPRLSHPTSDTVDEPHPVIFRSNELSHLVGFLETALKTLSERSEDPLEDIHLLLRRLRRGLRKIPEQERQSLLSRYGDAFESLFRRPPSDEGIHDMLHFPGENPASRAEDIRALIEYAIDHRLCIEITYDPEQSQPPDSRIVEPVSEDHAMLYAYCRSRKG